MELKNHIHLTLSIILYQIMKSDDYDVRPSACSIGSGDVNVYQCSLNLFNAR